jgi:hypothetical protein
LSDVLLSLGRRDDDVILFVRHDAGFQIRKKDDLNECSRDVSNTTGSTHAVALANETGSKLGLQLANSIRGTYVSGVLRTTSGIVQDAKSSVSGVDIIDSFEDNVL